jgi:Flp pilus assembly protein TadB
MRCVRGETFQSRCFTQESHRKDAFKDLSPHHVICPPSLHHTLIGIFYGFAAFPPDFIRPSIWTYASFFLALLTLPIFVVLTTRARRSSSEDRMAEELLERIASAMKGG